MKIISVLCLLSFSVASIAQKRTTVTVHFDTDKYNISSADAASLDSLVASFNAGTKPAQIEISGYCDQRASDEHNKILSQNRARSVENYLLGKGVDHSLITKVEGYGESMPVQVNNLSTDQKYALDRRVEIVITTPEEKIVEKPVEIPVEKPVEKTLTKTIEDTATKEGTKITLKNLNFVGGLHVLLPESMPILEELLSVMQNNPKLVISIEGHVCCIPDKFDGVDLALGTANLSVMRAKAVYEYLLRNGIAADRVSYKGWGHQNPIYPYPERSEEEKTLNRRVELVIISK